MERDDDFLRELLFKIEETENGFPYVRTMGEDSKKLGHLELLCDKRLICQRSPNVYRLTSDGDDFIEAIRDDGIWKKTKDTVANVAKNGGQVTLEILKTIAIDSLKGGVI